jgi:hypothetical protein
LIILRAAAFFGLTFSTGAGENRESFRVSIEFDEEDEDLLGGSFVNARPRVIVRSAAILGLLPIDVDDDWSLSGTLLDRATKDFWIRTRLQRFSVDTTFG